MFGVDCSFPESIKKLLEKPETTLSELLKDSSILFALKNPSDQLILFFSQPKVYKELYEYTLCSKRMQEPDYKIKSQICLEIVSTQFEKIMGHINNDNILFNSMRDFMESDDHKNPRLSGHFQRMVESITRLTSARFLVRFPELRMFIQRNVDQLAYRDLFIVLSIDFTEEFGFNAYLIIELLKSLSNESNHYFLFSSLKTILIQNTKMAIYFKNEIIIKRLMKYIGNRQESFECYEALSLVIYIIEAFPEFNSILSSFSKHFVNIAHIPIQNASLILQLYPKLLSQFVDTFFSNEPTLIDNSFAQAFSELSEDDIINIVEENRLGERIIGSFQKSKVKGQIVCVVEIILKKEVFCPQIATVEWNGFINNNLLIHIKNRDSIYGGKLPESYFSSFDDNQSFEYVENSVYDDLSSDYEEEEDFFSSSEDYSYDEVNEEPFERTE